MATEPQIDPEARRELGQAWRPLMFAGVLMIVLGCVAILIPAVASWGVTIFIGWILLIASAFLLASAFTYARGSDVAVRIVWAVLTAVAGLYLLLDPGQGTDTLTVVLVIYFIVMGLVRIGVAFSRRGEPNAGFLGLSGVLSLILGLLILGDLPSSADWAIGLIVGIDLIFAGWALVAASMAGRELARGA